mgnify:CR=1 FL=1
MDQNEIDARITALLKGKRGKKPAQVVEAPSAAPVVVEEYHVDEVIVREEATTTATPEPVDPPSEYESARTTRKLIEAREEAKALGGIMASFNEFRKNNVGTPINEMLPTFGESFTQPTYGNNAFDHPAKVEKKRGNILPNTFCNNV